MASFKAFALTFVACALLGRGLAKTMASSSRASYATTVKALIDAGTCASITTTTTCGTASKAESYYETFTYKGNRVVIISGAPNHAAEQQAGLIDSSGYFNPNTRCSRWQYAVLPLSPTKSTKFVSTSMGTIGLLISGGVLFNELSDSDGSLAVYYEYETLDTCLGHSDGDSQYHYHGIPYCLPADTYLANKASECYLIGYMLDGFPIYGRCQDSKGNELKSCYTLTSGADGNTFSDYTYDSASYTAGTCHLDKANGYTFTNGSYGYITTDNVMNTPAFYVGTKFASVCGFTPS